MIYYTTGIAENKYSFVTIYPNPVNYRLNFDWSENTERMMRELYQLNGTKTTQKSITRNESISTGHIVKGIYIYKFSDSDGFIFAGKMNKLQN